MRRALTDFILRGVFIVVAASGLAWLGAGDRTRPRLVAATPPADYWYTGARACLKAPTMLALDTDDLRELQKPLRRIAQSPAPLAYMEPLIAQDDRWMAPLIECLLSDDESVARGAAATLQSIFERRRIGGDRGGSALTTDGFNEPEVRAAIHETLAQWYRRNRRAIQRWGDGRFRRITDTNAF